MSSNPDDAKHLVDLLTQDSEVGPEARAEALDALAALGLDALPALIEGLATETMIYIEKVFIGLDQDAVAALLMATEDEDDLRRANAALMLGKIISPRAIPRLKDLLSDEAGRVRRAAATALGTYAEADTDAVLPLCRLLEDEEGEVRSAAAKTLGVYGDARAVEALNEVFLHDEDERVRRTAHAAMRSIGEKAQQETIDNIDVFRAVRASDTLQNPDSKKSTDEIKSESEKLFHTFGIPRVELLLATLESSDHAVQRRAVRELIKMGPSVTAALLKALEQSTSSQSRANIAFALGELRSKAALGALNDLLESGVEDVRYAAENAIKKINEDA